MNQLSDNCNFRWIEKHIIERDGIRGNCPAFTVSDAIPPIFPAYARIFHHIIEDLNINDRTISKNEIRQLKMRLLRRIWVRLFKPKVERAYIEILREKPRRRRVRWKDLAERENLVFQGEIADRPFRLHASSAHPNYLYDPNEGMLDEEDLPILVDILRPHTNDQHCYFQYDLIVAPWRGELHYKGKLEEVIELSTFADMMGSPTYWWPESRGWCVFSEWDLTTTVIGGSKELIDCVLADSQIESLMVGPDTQINHWINA